LPEEREGLGVRILDTRFTPEWLADHPADQAMVEMMAARRGGPRTPEQLRGESEQMQARRHHDVSARLGAIASPTLIACGRYDGIAPLANGEWIAANVAGAELRVYEGGHVFFLQDSRALPEIGAFLAG
jgi:pimeloyl-ACP methyl ester carboxylesterase